MSLERMYLLESPAIKEVVVSAPEAVRARSRQSPSLSSQKPVAARARNSQEPYEFFCSHSITSYSWTWKRMLYQFSQNNNLRYMPEPNTSRTRAFRARSQMQRVPVETEKLILCPSVKKPNLKAAEATHSNILFTFINISSDFPPSVGDIPDRDIFQSFNPAVIIRSSKAIMHSCKQSQSQSSDHRAVINCKGDYGRRCELSGGVGIL